MSELIKEIFAELPWCDYFVVEIYKGKFIVSSINRTVEDLVEDKLKQYFDLKINQSTYFYKKDYINV